MYIPPAEHYDVVKAALRVVEATHYCRDSDPHASAHQEYSNEQLALAARALTEAVNGRPEEDQPIGWAGIRRAAGLPDTADRARWPEDTGSTDTDEVDRLRARVAELESRPSLEYVLWCVGQSLGDIAAEQLLTCNPDLSHALNAAREQGEAQHLTALAVHPAPWRIIRTDQTMPTVVDADGYIVAERVAPEAAQLIANAGADARSRLSEEETR